MPHLALSNDHAARPVRPAVLAACLLGLAVPAWAQQAPDDHAGHDDHEAGAGIVRLHGDELREFGIELAVAGPAELRRVLELPGEIRANDTELAHIVPRFPGIVTEVRARTGDRVRAGQVLAVIESDASLAAYEMKTLIAGTVIDQHITLGEAASREHAAFVVANLATVWADVTVYQRDLAQVAAGQLVRISGGHEGPEAAGEIAYLAPVVDETTRTALARVVLPNGDGAWRPGTFVTARVEVGRGAVPVAVPRTALQTVHGADAVFVAVDDGFAPRPVTLGRADGERVEIVAGLAAGERYVARGGFTLKAELGKASFGDGHAH